MEEQVLKALRTHGANKVAALLGVSREAAMSLALGIASNGTRALVAQNIQRLEQIAR